MPWRAGRIDRDPGSYFKATFYITVPTKHDPEPSAQAACLPPQPRSALPVSAASPKHGPCPFLSGAQGRGGPGELGGVRGTPGQAQDHWRTVEKGTGRVEILRKMCCIPGEFAVWGKRTENSWKQFRRKYRPVSRRARVLPSGLPFSPLPQQPRPCSAGFAPEPSPASAFLACFLCSRLMFSRLQFLRHNSNHVTPSRKPSVSAPLWRATQSDFSPAVKASQPDFHLPFQTPLTAPVRHPAFSSHTIFTRVLCFPASVTQFTLRRSHPVSTGPRSLQPSGSAQMAPPTLSLCRFSWPEAACPGLGTRALCPLSVSWLYNLFKGKNCLAHFRIPSVPSTTLSDQVTEGTKYFSWLVPQLGRKLGKQRLCPHGSE